MTPPPEDGVYGVYGLALEGLHPPTTVRPAPEPGWERWRVRQSIGEAPSGEGLTMDGERARIDLPGAGSIEVDRSGREIDFRLIRPLTPEALLHPGLVPVAATIAWWAGRVPVHASAVVVDGVVWGLLAEREGGKSTAAGLLWQRGYELFADDMLIVDGVRCFAGPPSVDLRAPSAARLGGDALGRVGGRDRFRLRTDSVALERELGGWVDLRWTSDERPAVDDVPPGDRVGTLAQHVSLPIDGMSLLQLADAPMLRYARPRDLDRATAHLDVLLDRLHRP